MFEVEDAMQKRRPDFSHFVFNEQQRHKVAILHVETGEEDAPQPRKRLSVLSEVLGTRNAFNFLKDPVFGLLEKGTNSYWLPIECAKAEIEQARAAQGDYAYYHDRWNRDKFKPGLGNAGAAHFIREIEKGIAPETKDSHYFYGIEAKCASGPAAMRHYFKIGIAKDRGHVEKRFKKRAKNDKWYGTGQQARGRFALPLRPDITGRSVEKLFEACFGTHCTLRENGQRYLKEFFFFDDVIAELAAKLEVRHPHPLADWCDYG